MNGVQNVDLNRMKKVHTLIIGSGAAGLCAAVRLRAEGIGDILIATAGLDRGTSINTGSDKQTYYKLSLCGNDVDSPRQMAETLFSGGSMHGDIALVEAALSARCFLHLVDLGVKFPTDAFGQFVGYKTDHDPRQRATSVGPYTSRDMCLALIRRAKELEIPVWEGVQCVELLKINQKEPEVQRSETSGCGDRVFGALFLDENNEIVPVIAENVIFAVGGPGDLYATSVYPPSQTSSIGLALDIGAEAQNLPESQFGMASTQFRWNVSGTYMQVIPRFVSTDANGGDEREFLLDYFDDHNDLYSKIFLKGYQWPFDVRKAVNGSSMIDILVHIETVERWRRVFLDFRSNPSGLNFDKISDEARNYLEKSGALFGTPIERLEKMNPGAVELYKNNGIDLRSEMLEIAVCAQHNNGGLAGTIWWESTNIKHLFPIGEVNGSHGVARPGGSALNSGQVGAFRAAEFIANRYSDWTLDVEAATRLATERSSAFRHNAVSQDNLRQYMSLYGGAIRSPKTLESACDCASQYRSQYPNDHFCLAHAVYLEAIRFAIQSGVGSRGSGMVLSRDGTEIHPKLDATTWKMQPEDESFRKKVLVSWVNQHNGQVEHRWEDCRPIPDEELWFETEWKKFRDGEIYTL